MATIWRRHTPEPVSCCMVSCCSVNISVCLVWCVFVNYLVKEFAIFLGVVVSLLLRVGGSALLDKMNMSVVHVIPVCM